MKIERIADRQLLNTYHSKRCKACNKIGCDPCHIRSRGAGGPDAEWNLMPLCRRHHTEQHQIGWYEMSRKHQWVYFDLKSKGWSFDKDGSLWNDLLKI